MKIQIITLITICLLLNNCTGADARKISPDPKERVKKNIEEGRGFRLSGALNRGNGNFLFASSNPMWRASLDKLGFVPLNVVDYSGGVIITDWYSDNSEDEIKITVRFLSNEIRSESLRIIVHKKKCLSANNCKVTQMGNNEISNELLSSIIKTAARFEKEDKKKK